MSKKSQTKGFLVYLPEYQHAYLKMKSAQSNKKMAGMIRDLLDTKIKEEYPVIEYKQRRDDLQRELAVVELMIKEEGSMNDHTEWVRKELERIVPNLAKGNEPTPELAKYVSTKLGMSWKDLWNVVEQYRETGKVKV